MSDEVNYVIVTGVVAPTVVGIWYVIRRVVNYYIKRVEERDQFQREQEQQRNKAENFKRQIAESGMRYANIRDVLAGIRTMLDADRTVLYMLHNGGKFHSGDEIQRCTAVCESINPGVQSVVAADNGIMLVTMPEVIAGIVNSIDHCTMTCVDELPDSLFKSRLSSNGIRYTMRKTLRIGHHMVGFVTVDWNHKPDSTLACLACPNTVDCKIRRQFNTIEGFLARQQPASDKE